MSILSVQIYIMTDFFLSLSLSLLANNSLHVSVHAIIVP